MKDFKTEEIVFEIDWDQCLLKELTIFGNESVFAELSSVEEGEWEWALYPPQLYFLGVPFETDSEAITINIDQELQETCDVALYMMEHCDIKGILTIDRDKIARFKGIADILGNEMDLDVEVDLKPS